MATKMKKIIFSTLIICLIFLAGGYAGYCVGHNDQESNITMSRNFSGGGAEHYYEKNMGEYKATWEIKEFVFQGDAEEKYVIPYIKIAGCPDDELQWKINKTIFNEACWIFSCAETGDWLYQLFLKDSSQSAISDFIEYPILDPDGFAEFTGFTEGEVKRLCEEHEMSFADARRWYDGYEFPGAHSE